MATEKLLIDLWGVNMDEVDTSDCTDVEDILSAVITYLSEQPTVDAVEVVHGRWEWFADRCEDLFLGCDDDYGWRCSHCKTPLEDCDDPEVPPTYNYCPNCGAKMDGDGNGQTD